MLRLLGYGDRISAAPGDTIRFMVSCESPSYEVRLVRLIHGDTNPAGPGFKQVTVPSAIDGEHAGKHEDIHAGSYVEIPLADDALGETFTFTAFVAPTRPGAGEQVVAARGDPYEGTGWALGLAADGSLEFVVGTASGAPVRGSTGRPMDRWDWYFVGVAVDGAGRATLWQEALRRWPGDDSNVSVSLSVPPVRGAGPLNLAAVRPSGGRTNRHLDGKLDRPRLIAAALDGPTVLRLASEPDALEPFGGALVGAWDFSTDISSDRVSDASPGQRHGRTVNMPTRAVIGHNYTGREVDWRLAPHEYGAIHFHADDLEDARWGVDFELRVPEDLPSGVYAAWLRAGDDEDHIPFIVRPRRGTTSSRIAILLSTMTYVAYSNFTDIGVGAWQEGATGSWSSGAPYADPTLFRDTFRYIDEHALYGLYDLHLDGSGVTYGSYLKPNLTMRPKFRYRVMGTPPRFPADLYLVDWLDQKGIAVDFITDHDLNAEGADLLRPYSVVVSSAHHEYWTATMLDALETYLGAGGRFMYLGGNGLYGVLSCDPARPHVIELRRWGTSWPFEVHPGERHHSMTGEPGGIWRNRGRAPNRIVGIGTAGAEFENGVPYRRLPDSHDPRVAFAFEGVEGDLIGDQPNLQVRWGAAGYEFDRCERELGSPAGTLVLASSVGFKTESANSLLDEELWFAPGREGEHPTDPQLPGEPHRFVRSDVTYLEYPNGGAVFAAGAICWRGALSAYNYENTVSQVTENVLRKFADPAWRP